MRCSFDKSLHALDGIVAHIQVVKIVIRDVVIWIGQQKTERKPRALQPQQAVVDLRFRQIRANFFEIAKQATFIQRLRCEGRIARPGEWVGHHDVVVFPMITGLVAPAPGAPADEAARLRWGIAGRQVFKIIIFHRNANEVRRDQLLLQWFSIKKLAQKRLGVRGTLAVRGDDDRATIIVMFQIIFECRAHVSVRQRECPLRCPLVLRAVRAQVRLPITRRIDFARAVEQACLVQNGAFIHVFIELRIVNRAVPGLVAALAAVNGGVQEKNIGFGGSLVIGDGVVGRAIGRVIFGRQCCPVVGIAVIRRQRHAFIIQI